MLTPEPAARIDASAADWTRRSVLAAGAAWSIALVGLTACAQGPARGRGALVAGIRSLYEDRGAAASIAQASGWNLERALRALGHEVPVTTDREAVARYLDARMREDFVEDRIQFIDRRWLSDTEVAVAVVLAEPRR